ncbi:MAG: hypothetical protein NTY66_02825 [Candidatus Vogelbacteria bacterium]|nr:hypothetical protein [Candidatus Vogelbacteria bacterium]
MNYQAVVEKIVPGGRHGPYAVARCDELSNLGPITFSLKPEVWEEKAWPETGTVIIISNLTKKRAGWRATSARFFQPADEQQSKEKEGQSNE